MKKLIFILLSIVTLASCGDVYTKSEGQKDLAYVFIVSDNQSYKGESVVVTIDDKTKFNAEVTMKKKSRTKGTSYAIATGKRHIKVEKDGKVLYDRIVMASTQETQEIVLP